MTPGGPTLSAALLDLIMLRMRVAASAPKQSSRTCSIRPTSIW
jgi:hypothetical protein